MKMFLVSNPGVVHVENAAGDEVTFHDSSEYLKFTGKELSSVRMITYEPDRGIYSEFDGIDTVDRTIPNTSFEEDIANVLLYQSRKDDPYYGATLEEAKELKISAIRAWASRKKREVFAAGAETLSSDGLQTIEELQAQALLAVAAGDAAWRIDVIMENEHPDGTNKRKTLSAPALITAIRGIWARNEAYNQQAQDGIDIVTRMTTVGAVKEFYKEQLL